jgi:hypothetical protein
MDLSNVRQKKKNEKEMKTIWENYETLAVQQILKSDVAKHFPNRKKNQVSLNTIVFRSIL